MRRLVCPLVVAALAATSYAPLGAEDTARWLSSSAPGASVRLLTSANQVTVQAGGRNTVLSLAEGALVEGVTAVDNGWVVAATETREAGREIVLMAEIDGQITALPAPAGRNDSIRDNPVLLTDDGQLAGLLWLQGSDSTNYRVEYSEWDGSRWRHRGRLTGRGPGSQLALDAVVLDDGSWLAVWSRYDRTDDEIYWSRYQDREWSTPQRVSADNAVPDIVPSLISIGNEALLAWSRFDDGEYRLRTARFNQGQWGDETVVGSPGTAFPTWHSSPSGPALVFRQALPSSWVWMEFDAGGQALRYSTVSGTPDQRPLPSQDGGQSQFLFPNGHSEAATWTTAQ